MIGLLLACKNGEEPDDTSTDGCDDGCIVAEELPGGLLSVRAVDDDDVWIVGASPTPADGVGPTVLHYDGEWTELDTSAWAGGELWWAWVTEDEAVFVGHEGLILELDRSDDAVVRVDGPEEDVTFFGVWGASSDDVWAVGTQNDAPAIWRRTAGSWAAWDGTPSGSGTLFKVHGTATDDVWIVGTQGQVHHWDGSQLEARHTPFDTAPLLTVDAAGQRPIVVGGAGNGLILEYEGAGVWADVSPAFQPGLNGVCVGGDVAWAVGQSGSRTVRLDDGTWSSDVDRSVAPSTFEDWHGCAVTPDGGLWTVGGAIASRPLERGVIGYQGRNAPVAFSL